MLWWHGVGIKKITNRITKNINNTIRIETFYVPLHKYFIRISYSIKYLKC